MELSRRDFIGLVGGAGAGIGLSQLPLRRLLQFDDEVDHYPPFDVERWVRTSCQICPGGCGMEVRKVDGVPVGVRGNPLHPISRGGLCPVGSEAMHLLYHPDRIRTPLRGTSEARPHADWRGAGWEESLEEVAARIEDLRAAGQTERIFLVDGYGRGLLSGLARRFMTAIDSPGYLLEQKPGPTAAAAELAFGAARELAYDLENASTVLSFGVPLCEGWESPLQGQRAVGGIRRAGAEDRSRALLHLDVRSSKTSDRADSFARVAPGGYTAAALSVAYVLISQKLYDPGFVETRTTGFEDWKDEAGDHHTGFKNYVLGYCRPQDLEERSGLATEEVLRIAKRWVASPRPLAIIDRSVASAPDGLQATLAVQALNALVGAYGRRGGAVPPDPVPFRSFTAPGPDSAADDVTDLIQRLEEGAAQVSLLFLLHADPFTSIPGGGRLAEHLDDALVVSFSPLPDETTRLADLVLPDLTFLERWQDCPGPTTFPYPVLGITRPVTSPLCNARNSGDVLLELARLVEGADLSVLPWKDYEEIVRTTALGAFDAQRGSTFTTEREAAEIREMEERGWWIPAQTEEKDFWEALLASGGWWDPAYVYRGWTGIFPNPEHRFRFYARSLMEEATAGAAAENVVAARLRKRGIGTAGDFAFLPHVEPRATRGERGERSLELHLFLPMVPSTAVAANLPWVRELLHDRIAWDAWAEIHEEDAARLGIEDGQVIDLVRGEVSISARALVSASVRRGVVAVPCGVGRPNGGRWATVRGANPKVLVAPSRDPLSGGVLLQGTRVRIQKHNSGVHHA